MRYSRWAITTALLSGARANQRQSYVSRDCPTGPVSWVRAHANTVARVRSSAGPVGPSARSEEHTSELQSQSNLVCRLLLEKKKNKPNIHSAGTYQLQSAKS